MLVHIRKREGKRERERKESAREREIACRE